jgi:hypothetical protein
MRQYFHTGNRRTCRLFLNFELATYPQTVLQARLCFTIFKNMSLACNCRDQNRTVSNAEQTRLRAAQNVADSSTPGAVSFCRLIGMFCLQEQTWTLLRQTQCQACGNLPGYRPRLSGTSARTRQFSINLLKNSTCLPLPWFSGFLLQGCSCREL